jgi:hypothetical protein
VGKRTEVCATLDNWTNYPQTVTLEFSQADFSIGLPATRIPHPNNPQTVTIPAHGSLKVCISFVPTHPGHLCIQIRISKPGYKDVTSWKNMDVVEPLQPGQTDTLEFPIGNPLDHTADIDIDIQSNCPGWNVVADPARLEDVAPGEVRTVRLHVTPQEGTILGTECTVDVVAWADNQMIGGIRKIDHPPVPHPPQGRPYDEREIEIRPFPLEAGVRTEVCAVLENKSNRPQTVTVEFSMADFNIGTPFQHIPAAANPQTVTIPPYSTIKSCIRWTPLTPGHKCFQIRISQAGYEDIISYKNLDVGEHLRPGQEDQLVISVGNPKDFTADIQIAVYSGCPGWLAWTEPDILRNVPPGGVRNVTLKVVPPVAGATLGSGCYIDVETYINGELISGIRKVDLPPVHPPVGEPPYAEREITIRPDPPVVGQPAQICATLHNYAGVDQTVDIVLYAMDFGMGLTPQEAGRLSGVVIPANTTIERCITWTPPPGSEHRCLQIRIQQAGYNDIISQRNIENVQLPGIVHLPLSYDFKVGNTTGQTKTVQLNTKEIGLASGWSVALDFNEVTLGPGQTVTNTMHIQAPSHATTVMQVDEDVLPGDAHLVAVEAFIDDELIGGVLFEFEAARKIYLPVIMKKWTILVPDTPTPPSAGWVNIFSEDFEGSFPGPWGVVDTNGTSYGEYYWGKRTCKPYAGSYSGWSVGGGANGTALACGSNYPDNAESWMVYGPFSLVGATAGDLSFKLWLNSEENNDKVCRMASIDGKNFYGLCTSGNTAGWVDKVLNLTSVDTLGNLMGQPNVWVALMFRSDSSTNTPEGGYVDNIVLRKCTSATCTGVSGAEAAADQGQVVESPVVMTLAR